MPIRKSFFPAKTPSKAKTDFPQTPPAGNFFLLANFSVLTLKNALLTADNIRMLEMQQTI
jgi:hypothetical protein